MLEQLKAYIEEQHLLPRKGQRVLLAVSGGRDSVCMANLMHEAGYPFAIAHCNFHLRPGDCDRDQQFVGDLSDRLGVVFHTTNFDTHAFAAANHMSAEEAARHLRYDFFADLCRAHGYYAVVTAHHRDDSIETLFLNLFRGTGIAGLHGIRPVSELVIKNEALRIIRPLLPFSRADIDAYVRDNHLEYVEDVTNGELSARRNRIRLVLMPLLRQLYPSVDLTLQADIERFADAEQLYNDRIEDLRMQLVHAVPPRVPTMPGGLQEICLANIPEPRHTVLFELLRPYGVGDATVRRLLTGDIATGKCFSTDMHDIVYSRGRLVVGRRLEAVAPVLEETEEPFVPGSEGIYVDADRLVRPLTLRLWHQGDRIHPFGSNYARKVSDVLKDMKINRIEKKHVWVLADADGRIVWLVGLMADNRFRVDDSTHRVLHISLKA